MVSHSQSRSSLRGAAGDEAISVQRDDRDCFATLAMTAAGGSSGDLDQFLEAPEAGRDRLAAGSDPAPPIGERYLPDIDVAAGIDSEAVRRDELAGVEPGMRMAEPRQQLPFPRIDADPGTAIREVDIDRHVGADLANEEARRLRTALHVEAGGTVHVVPLSLVLAVAVEHLDAVILAVGHIDPAVGIATDVVGDVELARIRTRLAPGHHPLAVRGVFVDAGIPVTVRDVEVVGLRRQRGVGAAVK